MADVLSDFIDRPGQKVLQQDHLNGSTSQHPNRQAKSSSISGQVQNEVRRLLDEDKVLQKLVDQRVHEIIQQMFKKGELARAPRHNTAHVVDYGLPLDCHDQSSQAGDPSNGSESSLKGEALERHSIASHVSKRGWSAHVKEKLLLLWGSMLDVSQDSIRPDDSFFELGGDSIGAMKLAGAAREEGLPLTVADIFRSPVFEDMLTIIRMAHYSKNADINNRGRQNRSSKLAADGDLYQRFALLKAVNVDDAFLQNRICPRIGVFKGGIADVLPVTDFQALSISWALLESRLSLNYFYLDGRGLLDVRRLKQSCFRVVHAFDILRTVFLCSGNHFLQVILRKMRPDFHVYETDKDLDEFTAMLRQRDREHGPRQGEPFVKFIVVRAKASDHHRILIRLSHTQYDGVCLPRILSAIQAGYEGGPIPTTPSFANYVRASAETVTKEHYDYWRALLKDSRMTEIVRREGPCYNRSTGVTKTLKKTIRLPHMAHGHITTATIIKAAWALTLAKFLGQQDIVFGHTINGRNTTVPGVNVMVGPCLSIIPVRVRFQEHWTALDLLRYVQDQQVANMPYESLGYREIIKHCTDWPNWTWFTSLVEHLNIHRETEMQLGANRYKVGGTGADDEFSDFTILSTPQEDDRVEIALGFCDNGVINPSFAQNILDRLCEMAVSFTSRPNAPLPSPSALSDQPSQVIIEDRSKYRHSSYSEEEHFLLSHLKGLSRAEVLVLSDILSRIWREVLTDNSKDNSNSTTWPDFQLDSSFFDLNGDIVSLAQAASLLEQEGFKVRLEDLIEHPTMLGHMAVLALHNSEERDKDKDKEKIKTSGKTTSDGTGSSTTVSSSAERSEAGAAPPLTPTPAPLTKAQRTKSWTKALSLARKVVRRNARSG